MPTHTTLFPGTIELVVPSISGSCARSIFGVCCQTLTLAVNLYGTEQGLTETRTPV